MKKVLITGATGNIGKAIIDALFAQDESVEVFAAVRDIEKAKQKFSHHAHLNFRQFDFEDATTFNTALQQIDTVFLLRPPQMSDVTSFEPLVKAIRANNIKELVFLSVQGAEKSKIIPHNKIEALIRSAGLNYIFLRPSYFMQNLTTTLYSEIKKYRTLTLPAGNAQFNWVDILDIAQVGAVVITEFNTYKNQALVLTGAENLSFSDVIKRVNQKVKIPIRYVKTGPIRFYFKKRREGISAGFAVVQLVLHFLPRFQKAPEISPTIKAILGRNPTSVDAFVTREIDFFD